MISIRKVMATDHKRCDELYAKAELCVSNDDWESAQKHVKDFVENILFHFHQEEDVLFPSFEEITGMRHGPTEMMRHEHEQMRALITELEKTFENKNKDRYLGLSETLLIYMQQHNMKEEQMLYPMIDEKCADRAEELINGISCKINNMA